MVEKTNVLIKNTVDPKERTRTARRNYWKATNVTVANIVNPKGCARTTMHKCLVDNWIHKLDTRRDHGKFLEVDPM